jgi:hypothetical protein
MVQDGALNTRIYRIVWVRQGITTPLLDYARRNAIALGLLNQLGNWFDTAYVLATIQKILHASAGACPDIEKCIRTNHSAQDIYKLQGSSDDGRFVRASLVVFRRDPFVECGLHCLGTSVHACFLGRAAPIGPHDLVRFRDWPEIFVPASDVSCSRAMWKGNIILDWNRHIVESRNSGVGAYSFY